MARVHFVEAARQRYEMVDVLDEHGNPIVVPTIRTTKHGRIVERRSTVADKSKPLPNYKCEQCGTEIKVGMPYKWVQPKSGPYGGIRRNRCMGCPTWQEWDLSSSLSASLARIVYEFEAGVAGATSGDEIKEASSNAAEQIRELAEEKRSGADNIRDGFGHDTFVSEELDSTADTLEQWADEIDDFEPEPGDPEASETECDECDGSGLVECNECGGTAKADDDSTCATCEGDGEVECEECNGECVVTPDEPTDGQVEEWRDNVLAEHPITNNPL